MYLYINLSSYLKESDLLFSEVVDFFFCENRMKKYTVVEFTVQTSPLRLFLYSKHYFVSSV